MVRVCSRPREVGAGLGIPATLSVTTTEQAGLNTQLMAGAPTLAMVSGAALAAGAASNRAAAAQKARIRETLIQSSNTFDWGTPRAS